MNPNLSLSRCCFSDKILLRFRQSVKNVTRSIFTAINYYQSKLATRIASLYSNGFPAIVSAFVHSFLLRQDSWGNFIHQKWNKIHNFHLIWYSLYQIFAHQIFTSLISSALFEKLAQAEANIDTSVYRVIIHVWHLNEIHIISFPIWTKACAHILKMPHSYC